MHRLMYSVRMCDYCHDFSYSRPFVFVKYFIDRATGLEWKNRCGFYKRTCSACYSFDPFNIAHNGCTDTSAPVPKCLGHFGTDHRGSHDCQRWQLRSGRGGELKAVDVYVPLSLNCGF